MATTTVEPVDMPGAKTVSARKNVWLVFLCTIIGAMAQMLIKTGANRLPPDTDLIHMITNIHVMTGYSLYGIATVLLVLALKNGELSILYPIISLTYVWVTALSLVVFNEKINLFKLIGVTLIVLGVGVLGRNGRK